MEFKTCSRCGQTFPATTEFFHRSSVTHDRLHTWCKACVSQYKKEYLERNREDIRGYGKEYRERNQEAVSEHNKEYRERNRDHIAKVGKQYLANHPHAFRTWYRDNAEHRREYMRQYREQHAAQITGLTRDWYARNRDHVREYRKRFAEDPRSRICNVIGAAMCRGIRGGKGGRHWEELVGYTLADLMEHLESLFLPGMSWGNHGHYGWHIDHIRPRTSFKYTSVNDPEFRECWALSNLQPLWAKDNLSKGAKIA